MNKKSIVGLLIVITIIVTLVCMFSRIRERDTGSEKDLEIWSYEIDEESNRIILNKYIGDKFKVTVYGSYRVNGKKYTTALPPKCSYMFKDKSIIKVSFSKNIDTSKVTDMSYMFAGCPDLTDVSIFKLDTSNVTNMSGMFLKCPKLGRLDLRSIDTGNVTDMSYMFCESKIDELLIYNWNTEKVTTMESMFSFCDVQELYLYSFDTSNVTDMSNMFFYANIGTLDISSFDTSNVQKYDSILEGDIKTLVKSEKFTLKDAYENYIEKKRP